LLFEGCSLWEQFFPKEEKPPSQLMQEGLRDLEKGSYTAASEAFQKVKDRYPYSPFAVEAELRLGDALYKRRQFADAYDIYDDFVGLHPTNPEIPYAMYQKGMCHFSQIKTIDRDQSHTRKAKEDFELLVRRFPKSRYASRARRKIRECYIALAEHELYVGHFYFKRGDYRAAMGRYRFILENYPDLGQYKEALEYMQRCKQELRKEEADS
jgi:outer membrane protein assembly factor BamD